ASAQSPTPAESGGEELQLAVALFRHGVRAPLEGFANDAGKHSGEPWPTLDEWGACQWGCLTDHGRDSVSALGRYYGKYYGARLGATGMVSLWAVVDSRTKSTATARATGLRTAGMQDVRVAWLPSGTRLDPLFHPFKAGCGQPDLQKLQGAATEIC